MADESKMGREEVRAALLARIEAAWPAYKGNAEIARAIELGSNDDLRKHLACAELLRDTVRAEPTDWVEPSGDFDEKRPLGIGLTTRTGNELPSHCYALAKDFISDYDGPAWVPFNLWSGFKYAGHETLVTEASARLIETPGAEVLWAAIAKRYARPDLVSVNLPAVCANALAKWRDTPRDTPREFRDGRERLARNAEQLAIELERFYLPRDPDDCEFPALLDFAELMTQEELDQFDQAIRITTFRIANRARKQAGARGMDWAEYNDIGEEARALGYPDGAIPTPAREDAFEVYGLMQRDHTRPNLPYGGVPTLPDMLRRIAKKFDGDANYPPLSRPNLENAERNFFTRFLCKYFWQSFGDVSPAIVRDIVAIFFPQGIGENEVSQIVAKVKKAHPLPPDPESSTSNSDGEVSAGD
jgi:hypothetical protein